MNFVEHAGKAVLKTQGIPTPPSALAHSADEAAKAAEDIGPCVVKAQVPTGKRGKAGGIKLAANADEAREHASAILGMEIDGWPVEELLIEGQVPIARELYAAIISDFASNRPMLLFSPMGGMDVEEAAEQDPNAMKKLSIPIEEGLDPGQLPGLVADAKLGGAEAGVCDALEKLYGAWVAADAELIEINPLVVTKDDQVIALDCKLTVDDSSIARQSELAASGAPEKKTTLEARAAEADLKYIELDGEVGVLANGAGLTMTTMDVVAHYGGRPANFMEIGGEAYTKATTALGIVLDNPKIKSLLVNFCGAFARTDVMAEGVVKAWEELKPDIPIFFTIHGTGEEEAVALVKERLGIDSYDLMDDAVKAAVNAANGEAAR